MVRKYLVASRREKRMTQAEVAREIGVTRNTIIKLESGLAVDEGIEAAVEKFHGWTIGSLDRIRDGGEPERVEGTDNVDDVGTIDLKNPRDDYEEEVVASSLSRREKREIIADWRVTVAERKRMLRARAESHSNRAEASNDANTAR